MRGDIWRRRLWFWIPPLLIVLIGTAGLLLYRVNYAGESAGLERRLADKESQLARVTDERESLANLLERVAVNRQLVDELYQDRFSTRRQRLTQVTDEVKSLARQAGLVPQVINYPEEEIEGFQLVERAFVFNVTGNYQQLRTFINLLELSPSFLILKEVAVSPSGNSATQLQISLTLATIFAQGEGAGEEASL